METSIFIARLIGPLLLVAGLSILVKPRGLRETAEEFMASRALIFLAGVLALLAGLAIVNTHNLWVLGWPVIITIFGWSAVFGGVVRMAFPGLTKSIGEAMLKKDAALRFSGGFQTVLGAYLMFVGYL